ncbi:hypothetical protein IP65_20095 [Novosphingobium sp. AAP1]|uniref:Panacea domain-containing protein n=1 Tax=Novosphingobium sp. AAP1 TaxID=1523413 RepID=UPI0006CD1FA5|nr:type II toxin-antitoxin system antitoxin SocA domain-containing protein [Novosphingobium sp. AAP1]KPF49855.1 hypothetical protein IP65_20095 [Novosphingobium sp. AAP1]
MYDARQVANYLLACAERRGIRLTNMGVLKHIYFAHGWHLASFGTPLITNRVEAWEYGPVVRAVYDAFKIYGAGPITGRATIIDWDTGELIEARADFSSETSKFLDSILAYYSGFGAFELSDLTHVAGGPWDQVWNAGDGKVRLNMQISNDSIRAHFISQGKSATVQ